MVQVLVKRDLYKKQRREKQKRIAAARLATKILASHYPPGEGPTVKAKPMSGRYSR